MPNGLLNPTASLATYSNGENVQILDSVEFRLRSVFPLSQKLVVRSYRVAKRSFVWRVTRGSAMAVHQPHPSPLQLGASSCNVILVKRLLDGCRYTFTKFVVARIPVRKASP